MRMTDARPKKRRATNLSVDRALLQEARNLQINLSQLLEERLRDVVREKRQQRWLAENAEAFAAYERLVERHGIFNEENREW